MKLNIKKLIAHYKNNLCLRLRRERNLGERNLETPGPEIKPAAEPGKSILKKRSTRSTAKNAKKGNNKRINFTSTEQQKTIIFASPEKVSTVEKLYCIEDGG